MLQIKQKLSQKSALLLEMLSISKSLAERLRGATELDDAVIGEITRKIEQRTALIQEIDLVDSQLAAMGFRPESGQYTNQLEVIKQTLSEIRDFQPLIEGRLQAFKQSIQGQLNQNRQLKRTLKGYYNKQVAGRSSFVDNRT